jgi:hypothetical protein
MRIAQRKCLSLRVSTRYANEIHTNVRRKNFLSIDAQNAVYTTKMPPVDDFVRVVWQGKKCAVAGPKWHALFRSL